MLFVSAKYLNFRQCVAPLTLSPPGGGERSEPGEDFLGHRSTPRVELPPRRQLDRHLAKCPALVVK